MRWLALISWIGLCLFVAVIGARWTTPEIAGWYRSLVRPAIAPPNWVFAPVWTALYLLMATAAWLISDSAATPLRTIALGLFLFQLCLNLAWTYLFFHRHAIAVSLAEILVLWGFIGATTLVFGRVVPASAWLMTPYWAWVTFASVLNAEYWRLN